MKKLITILICLTMAAALCGCCLKHDFAPATCTEPSTCTKCGKTEGEPLGHKEETDAAVEPTCEETGLTEGTHCSVCGEVLKAQEEIPALGHDWQEATLWQAKTCAVCGATEGEPLGVEGIDLLKESLTSQSFASAISASFFEYPLSISVEQTITDETAAEKAAHVVLSLGEESDALMEFCVIRDEEGKDTNYLRKGEEWIRCEDFDANSFMEQLNLSELGIEIPEADVNTGNILDIFELFGILNSSSYEKTGNTFNYVKEAEEGAFFIKNANLVPSENLVKIEGSLGLNGDSLLTLFVDIPFSVELSDFGTVNLADLCAECTASAAAEVSVAEVPVPEPADVPAEESVEPAAA